MALAEGYIKDVHCVTAAMEGMGIHYIQLGMLGVTATAPRVDGTSTYTDWNQPAVLSYEPQSGGQG